MTDGEFQLEMIRTLERIAGAASTFDTPEAFLGAFSRRVRIDISGYGLLVEISRDHWARQSWLQTHAAHGPLTFFQPENCVQPPYGHWGPGVYATCTCGERLAILRELVLPECEALVVRKESTTTRPDVGTGTRVR